MRRNIVGAHQRKNNSRQHPVSYDAISVGHVINSRLMFHRHDCAYVRLSVSRITPSQALRLNLRQQLRRLADVVLGPAHAHREAEKRQQNTLQAAYSAG